MSIEGERSADFPFGGERASHDEIGTLERWAGQLSELGFATVHRQIAVANDEGDAIFFKTQRHEGDAEGMLYTSLGVTKGGFENVQMRLTFNPSGELCDTTDTDGQEWDNTMSVMKEFMEDEEYDGELRQMIGYLHAALNQTTSPEVTKALLRAEPSKAAVGVRSMHDYILELIADNTQFATRSGEWHEVLDEHNVVSVFTHDILGDEVDDELRAATGFAPLTVVYEDRYNWRKYVYISHYGGTKTLKIQDMRVEDDSECIEVEDEDAEELIAKLYAPTPHDIRLMTEKLQEASIRIRNFQSSIDQEIMDAVQIGGANMLMDEMSEARSVPDYMFRLIALYNETEVFDMMKNVARTFGMFEMGDDPEYGKKAQDAMLKGLLFGLHVAANTMPDGAKEMIDFVQLDSICIGEDEQEDDAEAFDVTDDTASKAMLYYEAAETFHPFFDRFEDIICSDIHFQKYLKRGFGLMLSVMDQASKLYGQSVQEEMDLMRVLADDGIDLSDTITEIEMFLSEQSPHNE